MALALLTKTPAAVKPSAVKSALYSGPISARGTATGIIARMPAAADEVRLLVLNSLGEVASEMGKPVAEAGLVNLSFSGALVNKASKEVYFLMVKGFVKGTLAWEQRLGRFSFHS